VVKGTTNGVITDNDGKFSLANVPDNATIQFSFVGMKTQEVAIAGKSTVNLKMEEVTVGIEEVVAIGYGTMKKSDLTGSVARANMELFREKPNTNLMQSLQGNVPGLNVGITTSSGESPAMSIRGLNSISGSTSPLIVVDGIIFRGSLSDISPNDIDAVDVLKDASSAAIYGSESANGVIIITTKKGKKNGKPMLNYSTNYSIQEPTNVLTPQHRDGFIQQLKDAQWQQAYLAPEYTKENPNFKPTFFYKTIEDGYNNGTDTRWLDLVSQNSYIQNHNLSINGSNENSTYYISSSFADQKGYIVNDDYKRLTFRINLENKITNWLTIGTNTFVTFADYSGISPSMGDAYILSPLASPYDANGEKVMYPYGLVINPLVASDKDDSDKRLDLFGNVYGLINIPKIKGLTYKLNLSGNYRSTRRYQFDKYAENRQGRGSKDYGVTYDQTFDNILDYSKTIKDHYLKLTLVFGYEEREYDGTNSSSAFFTRMAMGYNRLQDGQADKQVVGTSAWSERSNYSMGRFVYNFKNKYLLTSTLRRDGFSGFGENKKIGYFPSIALGWVATEEEFAKTLFPFVNYLKFRSSYGQNGNRTVGRYETLAKMSSSNMYIFGDGASPQLGQTISSLSNQDLGWETTTGLNLALDFAVLSQRLRGTFEYYNTSTHDILYAVNLPTITGFNTINTNIGKVDNWGIEATLSSTNIKNKNFTWESTINFSLTRNEVVSILGIDNNKDGKEDDLISSNLFIGKSRQTIYNYNVLGIYQLTDKDIMTGYKPGQYKIEDINGDKTITPGEDRQFLGNALPSYRFSILNTFDYKNFSLKVFLNSIQGGKDYYLGNNTPNAGSWSDGTNVENYNMVEEFDYWTPSNPNAEYRQIFLKGSIDPTIYRSRSFVRLQDVSLSYNFGNKTLKKCNIGDLKIFISGQNLYTWTKWKGWDPETGQGVYYVGIPVLKNYTIGLNVTF